MENKVWNTCLKRIDTYLYSEVFGELTAVWWRRPGRGKIPTAQDRSGTPRVAGRARQTLPRTGRAVYLESWISGMQIYTARHGIIFLLMNLAAVWCTFPVRQGYLRKLES
ncbi:hypothetical protein EJ05DRAFT_475825 [Pseudovirgaria hyperparasitica]|uniref:Uncharacterized protein n=1 Tax=Pseudovirgaria hyperparasitica TaxID=470096 RepID=A0A6A6W7B5_9PEZI|nr:uncharacterized protein EJ05DRAFT_475825 [Pseudovirgaria hyperparasitica]KAF2758523.1 hypothetical protein EJ05DRAFT_475825 [Pseudovirgaria hyperparasitica]